MPLAWKISIIFIEAYFPLLKRVFEYFQKFNGTGMVKICLDSF